MRIYKLNDFDSSASGVIDHGLLSGLVDDDHVQYLLVDGSRAMSGNLTVNGNLDVTGDVTYLNSTITEIKDNIVLLNDGETASGVSLRYSGIEIDRGLLTNAQLVWDEDNDAFYSGVSGSLERVMNNLSDDTTPTLGGLLNTDGNVISSNGSTSYFGADHEFAYFAGNSYQSLSMATAGTINEPPMITMFNSGGTIDSPTSVLADQMIADINFRPYGGSYYSRVGSLSCWATASGQDNNTPSRISFRQGLYHGDCTEVFTIWSDGYIDTGYDFLPKVSGTLDVGSASMPFAEGHFDTLYNAGVSLSGVMYNLSDDLTPELGANLVTDGNIISSDGSYWFGPGHEFAYFEADSYASLTINAINDDYSYSAFVTFMRARGASGFPEAVQSGDNCGGLGWRVYSGVTYEQVANLYVDATASGQDDNVPNKIYFQQGLHHGARTEFFSMYSEGYMDTSYDFLPKTSGTVDIGSEALPFDDVYADDLHATNGWTGSIPTISGTMTVVDGIITNYVAD